MTRILIVEDRDSLREMLEDFLSEKHYVFSSPSAEDAERHLIHYPDIVLCDLKLPGKSGLDFIDIVKERCPESEVIIMTAFGDIPTAVEAMKKGAFDFIPKPLDLDLLGIILEKAKERILMKRRIVAGNENIEMVGESPSFKAAISLSKKYAKSNVPVLVTGESGTGKELVARYIHLNSEKKEGIFLAINSSAIPEHLFESELFGYEKGAFTGAAGSKKGLIETAEGGTVFFDEIGDMPYVLQGKILRLIELGEYQRIGGNTVARTDVRFIFATSKDLESLVKKGVFREDLYNRLSIFRIVLPPLRERVEDIPLLARYFAKMFAVELNKKEIVLREKTINSLIQREWRGNVRELKNLIEKWTILGEVKLDETPSYAKSISVTVSPEGTYRSYIDMFERKLFEFYLRKHNGNKLAVAKELNMNYKTLLKKLLRYGL